MVQLLNSKAIGSAIDYAHAAQKKAVGSTQFALVQCLEHARVHGDATLMARLINGMSGKGNKAAALAWISAFSPILFKADGTVPKGWANPERKHYVPFNVEKAEKVLYTEFEPEPSRKPLTDEAILKLVREGLAKRVAKAEEDGNVADETNVVQLKNYLARLAAVPFEAAA